MSSETHHDSSGGDGIAKEIFIKAPAKATGESVDKLAGFIYSGFSRPVNGAIGAVGHLLKNGEHQTDANPEGGGGGHAPAASHDHGGHGGGH